MIEEQKEKGLILLRRALNKPEATFREGQWEAIELLLQNSARLLVVESTGWGKSLVYFLATRLLREQNKGPTLLISPLLALMRNQTEAAERLGVKASTINSSNLEKWPEIEQQILNDQVDVLLISPERLSNQDFTENILSQIAQRIGLFVVDEAHCISDWGHDFRPDYRRIVRILQALPPNIPVLATTATANNRVVNDVIHQLGSDLQVIRGNLTRESLQLQNIYIPTPAGRMAWLVEHIPHLPGSGIIYTLTVRDSERVGAWLKLNDIKADVYHGKLNNDHRPLLENKLLDNEIKVLVATTALGMGFDKPDLGFVIHYQRPASVVHYYQQVGRAGRAIERAFGILLNGDEDDQISNYFINTAFPSHIHTEKVLNVLLNQTNNDGLSVPQLEKQLNLSKSKIEKVLKLLALESPAPVNKIKSNWYATPTAINYQPDWEKIKQLTKIRQDEQAQMQEYMNSQTCLMAFLADALDDPNSKPCGRCAVCLGQPFIPVTYSPELVNSAIKYLRRSDQPIEPRKKWIKDALPTYQFSGNIKENLRAEQGLALSIWGDDGWGKLVQQGKYNNNYFDDTLVQATREMIQQWNPQPFPTWVTCIPSLKRPELVPNFAERLADKLGLPFIPVVQKIKENKQQKDMDNSYYQNQNLDGVFSIKHWRDINGPVFLIDDVVDSRWTLTVVAALLRQAGSQAVFPVALALNSLSQSD